MQFSYKPENVLIFSNVYNVSEFMSLFPTQRLSEILRICLNRRDEQLPLEHGIKEEGLWNNLRQVTIFLTGAFAKNKSGDIPRPLMRSAFTKQLATSFNKAKGETSSLPSAALLFYCRTGFALLKEKVAEREKWMTAQIQKMLVPKLKATAKQFASSSTVTHPTVAIENMTDNIKNVFGEFILGELKELHNLVHLSEMKVDGEVKVVAYDDNGAAADSVFVRTAGRPHHIELETVYTSLKADGKDLAYVTASIVDRDGNLCPSDASLLRFEVEGAGSFRAVANGDPTCLEPFHLPQMHVFNGRLTVILQSGTVPGDVHLTVRGKGLRSASLSFPVVQD